MTFWRPIWEYSFLDPWHFILQEIKYDWRDKMLQQSKRSAKSNDRGERSDDGEKGEGFFRTLRNRLSGKRGLTVWNWSVRHNHLILVFFLILSLPNYFRSLLFRLIKIIQINVHPSRLYLPFIILKFQNVTERKLFHLRNLLIKKMFFTKHALKKYLESL